MAGSLFLFALILAVAGATAVAGLAASFAFQQARHWKSAATELRARVTDLEAASAARTRPGPDRRQFDWTFARLRARCLRYGEPFVLLVIQAEDALHRGQPVGAAAMEAMAQTLRSLERTEDYVHWLDEYTLAAVLVVCEEPGARVFLERARRALGNEPIRTGETTTYAVILGGVAPFVEEYEQASELLEAAMRDLRSDVESVRIEHRRYDSVAG